MKICKKTLFLGMFIPTILFFAMIVYAFTIHNIESEFNIYCDTGNFDAFIDYENTEFPVNNTLMVRNFNIKGIDNIKCELKIKTKAPLYLYKTLLVYS